MRRSILIVIAFLLSPAVAGAQGFEYSLTDEVVSYEPSDGFASATLGALIDDTVGGATATQAFALGLHVDAAVLIVDGLVPAGVVADLGGGSGPDYFGVSVYSGGATAGCVYAFDAGSPLAFGSPTLVAELQVSAVPGLFIGDLVGSTTAVTFVDTLGSPAVVNSVVVDFADNFPTLVAGSVTFEPVLPALDFRRGDPDGSGSITIADAVIILGWVFEGLGGQCRDALDANDDGAVNVADAVHELTYLFAGGPAPAAPFPSCGADPTADTLACTVSPACP